MPCTVNLTIQLHPQLPLQIFLLAWKKSATLIFSLFPENHVNHFLWAFDPMSLKQYYHLLRHCHFSKYFLTQAHIIPGLFLLYSLRVSLMNQWLCTFRCSHHSWYMPSIVIVKHVNGNTKCKETSARAKLGHSPSSLGPSGIQLSNQSL